MEIYLVCAKHVAFIFLHYFLSVQKLLPERKVPFLPPPIPWSKLMAMCVREGGGGFTLVQGETVSQNNPIRNRFALYHFYFMYLHLV